MLIEKIYHATLYYAQPNAGQRRELWRCPLDRHVFPYNATRLSRPDRCLRHSNANSPTPDVGPITSHASHAVRGAALMTQFLPNRMQCGRTPDANCQTNGGGVVTGCAIDHTTPALAPQRNTVADARTPFITRAFAHAVTACITYVCYARAPKLIGVCTSFSVWVYMNSLIMTPLETALLPQSWANKTTENHPPTPQPTDADKIDAHSTATARYCSHTL